MYGLRHISVGKDGTVWGAANDVEQTLYYRKNDAWHKDEKGGRATAVAVGSKDHVWCVNNEGKAYELGSEWKQDTGAADAKTISVDAEGTVWYGKKNDQIYRRGEDKLFHQMEGGATVVSIGGKDQTWCVNKDGEVFHWVGDTWKQDTGAKDAETISAGADGTVWYIDTPGTLRYRNNSSPVNTWTEGPDHGIAIAVAVGSKDLIWSVNAAGQVFHMVGGHWTEVTAPQPSVVPSPQGTWKYTVKDGDTLSKIAADKYNHNDWPTVMRITNEIVRLNSLPNNGNDIKPPVELTMPHLGYR
jgi:LysM repeat protein